MGFNKICILDPNTLVERHQYDRNSWWSEISNEPVSSKNNIVSIHDPTLRFLAKWLAMVVHSHIDLRLCSLPELQYLYAMANKIRFSPVRSMLAHWQKMIMAKSPIDITSLVTRVARYVKAMEGAEVTFLPKMEAYRYEVGLEHFVQGHMMREGPENSIFMCYPGYDREIELPCPRLSLSLLGEKSNIADGEKRTRTTECCRSTDKEQDPTRADRSRSIMMDAPGCAERPRFMPQHNRGHPRRP